MVFDLLLNEDFEVEIDHRGDLATVDGRRGFEQSILLHLTERFTEIIDTGTEENKMELARVEAERVAREMDMLNRVAGFDVEMSSETPELMLVTIIYESGDTSDLEVET